MTRISRTLGIAALATGLMVGVSYIAFDNAGFVSTAQADSHGGGGQGGGGQGGGGQGGGGAGAGGQGGGGQGAGGQGGKGGHATTSSEEEDSDKRGPHYGKPADDTRGGKPSWAQEGIPEVELGRLNVVRAPSNILDRARQDLISNTGAIDLTAYASIEAYLAEIADWDNAQIIDSPLQNLAVFRDAINGVTTLPGVPVSTDLMAITLGTASDKNVAISEDTVTAIATIMGVDPATLDISTIATEAEAVRQAVSDAHG